MNYHERNGLAPEGFNIFNLSYDERYSESRLFWEDREYEDDMVYEQEMIGGRHELSI